MLITVCCITELLEVGCLMIEHVHAFDLRDNSGFVSGIGAIGVSERLTLLSTRQLPHFLLEEKTARRDTVTERNGRYSNRSVLENDLVGESAAVVVEEGLKQTLQIFVGIDVEVLGAVHHAPGGDESQQSEAVVSMEV